MIQEVEEETSDHDDNKKSPDSNNAGMAAKNVSQSMSMMKDSGQDDSNQT